MSLAAAIVEILTGALPVAEELAERAMAGEDVTAEAEQHAADLAYKLSSQQLHLLRAERRFPGFVKDRPK